MVIIIRIPKNFKTQLRNGVVLNDKSYFDNRLNINIGTDTLPDHQQILLNMIRENKLETYVKTIYQTGSKDDLNKLENSLEELNFFDNFYMSSSSKFINLLFNPIIIYNSRRIMMALYVFLVSSIIYCIFAMANFIFTPNLVTDLLYIFITSTIFHELGHCIAYWYYSENKSNGYFSISYNSIYYCAPKLTPTIDKIIALMGGILGAISVIVLSYLLSVSSICYLILALQVFNLTPFSSDGKIIWERNYNV